MEYDIIREPFLFMETMELLYKHVNHVPFSSLLVQRRERGTNPAEQIVIQRLAQLQQIQDEVCRDIDPSAPALVAWFTETNTEHASKRVYLAKYMIDAFMDFKRPGFDDTAADILHEWETMCQNGGWVKFTHSKDMQYTCAPGSPGDLFAQVYALDLPAEFRLRLYGVLHRFPEALAELTELMRPAALRLEQALNKARLPIGDMADYWVNAPLPPLEFLGNTLGPQVVKGAGDRLRLAISLMNANQIDYAMEHEPGRFREYSFMYIGSCISASSLQKQHSAALDDISTVLRGLSERKRLEVLCQLAKKRLYGQELAEILGMDRGNLSRLLAVLHDQGFVLQEKENQRTYYRADRAAMERFFGSVLDTIFD